MRALVVDDAARAAVTRVMVHAEANHYHPWASPKPNAPGDDERFVAQLGSYRCVFSYTHSDGAVWRHLSVSVPGKNFPHPFAMFTIATLFGFTGWDERTIEPSPAEWEIEVKVSEHCVMIGQIIRAGALAN